MSNVSGAGWHPDPQQPDQLRYWDGQRWTDHTAPSGAPRDGGYGQADAGGEPGQQPDQTTSTGWSEPWPTQALDQTTVFQPRPQSGYGQQPGQDFGQPHGQDYGQPHGYEYGQPAPGYGQSAGQDYGQPPGPGYGPHATQGYGAPGGPSYPPPASSGPNKGWIIGGGVAVLLLIAVIVAVAINSGKDEDAKGTSKTEQEQAPTTNDPGTTSQPATTSSTTQPEEEEAPPTTPEEEESTAGDVVPRGETGTVGGYEVVINNVEDPYVPSNEFETPEAGERLVAVEVSVTNTTGEDSTFSTLLGMEVTDSEFRAWDIAFAGFDRPQVDGAVPAGGTRRGWVVFGVGESAEGLSVRVADGFTGNGTVFALG